MAKLIGHQYGKAKVRVMKVLRDGAIHRIKDIDVAALLVGDFESSYTSGDNTKVVPTDTIKNTIQVLAHQHLHDEIERFALTLAEHFLNKYEQVEQAEVRISERPWNRMSINRKPHPHSFTGSDRYSGFTDILCRRDSRVLESGVSDLLILKSTGSGFENYPKDEFTTLQETSDRILATAFSARWKFRDLPGDCRKANESMLGAMEKVFAETYSPSAQTTLFQMGQAALEVCPEVLELSLAMPNKHCLLVDLSRFGVENKNEIFVPTDEPHGQIEATIAR